MARGQSRVDPPTNGLEEADISLVFCPCPSTVVIIELKELRMTKKVATPKPAAAIQTKPSTRAVKLTPKTSTEKATSDPKAKLAIVAKSAQPVEPKSVLKKAELVDKVVEQTGVKKRDAKVSVEAALGILAQSLGNETELNLSPMGKVRLIKSKDVGDGAQVLTLKLRTMKTKAPVEEG